METDVAGQRVVPLAGTLPIAACIEKAPSFGKLDSSIKTFTQATHNGLASEPFIAGPDPTFHMPPKMVYRACQLSLRRAKLRSLTSTPALSSRQVWQTTPARLLRLSTPDITPRKCTDRISRPRSYSTSEPSLGGFPPPPPVPTGQAQKPDYLDEAESIIWDRLAAEFEPVELVVRDVSGGCGSMYAIDITAKAFRGKSILKQQRMVNGVLEDLVKGWHGMQLRTKAP